MINIDCVITEGGVIEATISKDLTINVELIGSGIIEATISKRPYYQC